MNRNQKFGIILIIGLLIGMTASAYCSNARVRISDLKQQIYLADDIKAEISFGRNLAARILGNLSLWENQKANHYINLVGRSLSLYAGRSELEFSFGLLDTDDVNAYATPGGYIFITRGALERMTDEAELAAVIGHEMAHIIERHMVAELGINSRQASTIGGLAGIIGGATGGVRGTIENSLDQAAYILFNRGYKIKDEIEADRVGVLIASTAGYDPWALQRFLKTVGRFEVAAVTEKKDHPELPDRLSSIEKTITDNGLVSLKMTTMKERFNEMVSHP